MVRRRKVLRTGSLLDMEHIWDFIHTVDVNDIREVLERQKTYNMAIAREGMRVSTVPTSAHFFSI